MSFNDFNDDIFRGNDGTSDLNKQMRDLNVNRDTEAALSSVALAEAAGTYQDLASALAAEHALTDEQLEQQHIPEWASQAAVYTFDEEFGDVPPRFEAMEKELFGDQDHVTNGEDFDIITNIEVRQEGQERIMPVVSFETAGLHPAMLENIKLAGFTRITPIQSYVLSAIHMDKDIVACAQTGSGKTVAYLVPTISKLMGKAKKLCAPRPGKDYNPDTDRVFRAEPLIVIVVPNRELAVQIFNETRRFCYRTRFRPAVVYGGAPVRDQVQSLAAGVDLLIGTPGRLAHFIEYMPDKLSLKRVRYIIIDEADEMLGRGFEDKLRVIIGGGAQDEGNIRMLMFSATFPPSAREIADTYMSFDHCRITVGRAGSSHANIQQNIIWVEGRQKREALVDLMRSVPPCRTLIFVNTRRACDELDDWLHNQKFPVTSIHSERSQREREGAIRAFRKGDLPIMVATGVAGRGLDIAGVMHVIQYDLPIMARGGIEEYTHRIGRTGRIGNKGLATAFYNERNHDMAPEITVQLIETNQVIPDFLEEYRPQSEDGLEGAADGGEDLMNPGYVAGQAYNAAPSDHPFGGNSAVPFGPGSAAASSVPFGGNSAVPFGSGPIAAKVAAVDFHVGW